ncbi:hypothetical protein OAX78_01475 [Planctomycetota bacterium]|nr:hypothetical protein [Planctomycetota bacterium]
MKKFFGALLVAVCISGVSGVMACGGMTQIDPPTMQLETGPQDDAIDSIMDEIESVLVIC